MEGVDIMGKIDNFFAWMYESDYEAVKSFIEEGYLEDYEFNVTTKEAVETAIGYLCFNNIKHYYHVVKEGEINLVSIVWREGGEEQSFSCWCKGEFL